jgi:N-acetylmuramoyl-L-alanine amidase
MIRNAFFFKSALNLCFFLLGVFVFGQNDTSTNSSEAVKTVVIDAGHGGRDPGCVGRFLKEKDVALFISLKLGDFIKKAYPQMNVLYTRDEDVFIPLDERAKVANDNEADLFISIHANAASPSAYGTETFVLGLHRTESQRKVMERENSTIHFEEGAEEKYKDFDLSPEAIIARQLQQGIFLDHSISFAENIESNFVGLGRKSRGVKQAGFLVLYKTTVPSVLVEVGFLTNRAEESFFRDTLNRIKIANSLFKSFQNYKNQMDGVERLIQDGEGFKELMEKHETDEKDKSEEEENNGNSTSIEKDDAKNVVFRVQIATSSTALKLSDSRFKGNQVWEYQDGGLFKYTTARTLNDIDTAKKHQKEMREKGFEHAFVIAFNDEERITIADAIKLLKGN